MNNNTKVAVITGASGGIGSAVAERLAADGFAIVASYAGSPQRANDLVKRISSTGGAISAFKADVADEADVKALFDQSQEQFGGSMLL